ncbi:jun dimerization protein 2-like [Myotis daubentonii]|uniref:jun dimerization protein 2-like n=1 Tax=Myotis daubentonii TaxID=98922 RepID=UPI0028731F54|nr:jun dimerization protein 2-like [Myotis daubentonii]
MSPGHLSWPLTRSAHGVSADLCRQVSQYPEPALDLRWKRGREKNKVAAAPCQNKKKERKELLQREPEWLEHMNAELKTRMEELKQEWQQQQLILMLSRHRPTCIVRTDSVKTPDLEGNPLLEQLEKKWPWAARRRRRRR